MKNLRMFFLSLTFLCAGCSVELKDKDKNQPQPPETVVNYGRLAPDQLNVDMGGTTPHQYDIKFSWPPTNGELVISNDKKESLRVNALSGSLVWVGAKSNYEHSFLIEHFDLQGRRINSFECRLKTPEDAVITSGQLPTNTVIEAHRIFILDNSVITTGTYSLMLKADELYISRGTIQSFLPDARANNTDLHGRSGGKISILAKKAIGHLAILLRGEHGAIGLQGKKIDIASSCPGTDGGNGGNSSPLFLQISDRSQATIAYNSIPGKGGQGGNRKNINNHSFGTQIGCPGAPPIPRNGIDGQMGAIEVL